MNLQAKQQVVLAISSVFLICSCARQAVTSHESGPERLPPQEIDSNTFIEISLDGGGLYAGVNPTTRNNKLIENDGRILIKFRQLYTGERNEMFFTSRAEVERLARFIRDNAFFAMKNLYDCAASDGECEYRKKKYPRPVPLRMNVVIGNSEKQVTVTIFKMGVVDYPDELETIVSEIDGVIRQARE
jgi:hypothetical protein